MCTALCLGDCGEVGGLCVLHFGCVNWDTVVDNWNSVVAGMGRGIVSWGSNVAVIGCGVSCKVFGLGVLDLGGIDWDAVVDLDGRASVGPWGSVMLTGPEGALMEMVKGTSLGMSVSVSDLGSCYFGCVVWHSMSGVSMGPWGGIGQRGRHMGI